MLEIGQSLSHYRILRKIGQGGMGEVFLAHDTSLERNVAIKVLPRDMLEDPVARERFLREAKSAATLDHPHICVVHEASQFQGIPFIVMEYVEGETLRDRLERTPLPLDEAVRIAAEIAEALEAAHSRRVIHRDLKPANVMLTRSGHAKVMDFGLAKRLLSSEQGTTEEDTLTELTRAGTTLGTLAYMSPEQFQGLPVDHRSDLFSFGAVLYEMLARVHPFRKEVGMATAAAILSKDPPPLTQYVPGMPQQLSTLVSQLLAKAPDRRPQSMRGIHQRLKDILLEVQPRPDESGVISLKKFARMARSPRVAIPAAVVLVALVAFAIWFVDRQAQVRWAREEALPEVERLIEENDVWRNLIPVYRLAERVEAVIPNDPTLARVFSQCSVKIDIKTEPPGARIFTKEYSAPESEWTYLGVSPIEQIRVPIGIFRWKIEKEGYETVLAASSTWDADAAAKPDIIIPYDLVRTLDKSGSIPTDMVRVPGATTPAGKLEDFYIDRHEVTNRQFKQFIDSGGYRERAYWQHSFVKDGRELPWEEAVKAFVDQTGQAGPATWQAGDYPKGQAEYPVSGVSWYEAAAYAEYAGKSLPTDSHWLIARGTYTPMIRFPQLGGNAIFAPFSNFGGEGPVPAGSLPGVTAYGAFDMAGNVREWCWNETPYGRLIRGGAWDDNPYSFGRIAQAPPMDRSARNGFRCAVYPDRATMPQAVFQATKPAPPRDFYSEKPVDDSIFRVYKEQFSYDKTDLKAVVEYRRPSPGGWIQEKVSFDAAYGGERIAAYLFLPENAAPPYQTVIYFPGSASLLHRSSADIEGYYEFPLFLSFIVKNGRAVLYPVYKGTFERGEPALIPIHGGAESHLFSEYLVQLVKDFRRSIDYLETRPDVDSRKLAYYGMSWGGIWGAVIPAVEERVAASVVVGGRLTGRGRPEVNQINYVTRVKTPTLLLAGRYESSFDAAIKPMFDLLGTLPEHKELKAYDTDHIPPRNEYVRETLAWLDRYLGPVRR